MCISFFKSFWYRIAFCVVLYYNFATGYCMYYSILWCDWFGEGTWQSCMLPHGWSLACDTMSTSHWHCMILSTSCSLYISFKIELTMFNCSCGRCPKYFGDVYTPLHTAAARSRLQLANHGDVVPRAWFTQFGCRSFRVCGPTIWNRLPQDLRSTGTREQFKRRLKSWLWVCVQREARLIDIDWRCALHIRDGPKFGEHRSKNSAECSARFGLATCDYSAEVRPNFGKHLASFAAPHLRRFVLAADVN